MSLIRELKIARSAQNSPRQNSTNEIVHIGVQPTCRAEGKGGPGDTRGTSGKSDLSDDGDGNIKRPVHPQGKTTFVARELLARIFGEQQDYFALVQGSYVRGRDVDLLWYCHAIAIDVPANHGLHVRDDGRASLVASGGNEFGHRASG